MAKIRLSAAEFATGFRMMFKHRKPQMCNRPAQYVPVNIGLAAAGHWPDTQRLNPVRNVRTLTVTVASLLLFLFANSAVAQSGIPNRTDAEGESFRDEGPTAEDVLRALQRDRPGSEILYPVGMLPPDPSAPTLELMPEGMAIVDATGVLERVGHGWRFVFDSAGTTTSVHLIPNAVLEVMIRTAEGASETVVFVVSGEMTVFEGQNYLLPRVAQRSTRPEFSAQQSTRPREEPYGAPRASDSSNTSSGRVGAAEEPASSTQAPGSRSVSAPESVEDVLAALQAARPDRQAMAPVEIKPANREAGATADGLLSVRQPDDRRPDSRPASSSAHAVRPHFPADRAELRMALRPDGTVYSRKSGRIISRADRWFFVPQSDHPHNPEPPLELLQCTATEFMIRTWRNDPHGLVFTVTGELTLFEGENYLLPRMAMRRVASDNLRE